MSLTPDEVTAIVQRFRESSPAGLSNGQFVMSDTFPKDFESFKLPLIAHLSDMIEEALRTIPEEVSLEFAWGYLDGVLFMIQRIAELSLIETDRD